MIDGRRLLGVLDCVEPLAGAAFMHRFGAASRRRGGAPAAAVLWSDAATPDPAATGAAPASVLLGLHALERIGADAVAVPAAAAHVWYRDLCAAAHVPVMHIVECAAAELRRARRPGSRIAVLSGADDAATRLYRSRLARLAFDVMEIPPAVLARMADAVAGISRGESAAAEGTVYGCIDELGRAGATGVVLASADVSCAAHGGWAEPAPRHAAGRGSVLVIDPLESLARTAASWSRGGCDAWDLVVDIPADAPEPAAAPPA